MTRNLRAASGVYIGMQFGPASRAAPQNPRLRTRSGGSGPAGTARSYCVALQLMDSYLRVVKLISSPTIRQAIDTQSG